MMRRLGVLVFAVVFGWSGSLAAEEPPVPQPAEPAPVPAGPEDGRPFDLLVYLSHVRTLVSENMQPPRRTATDHGLYDTWAAILRPRAARIAARVKRLMEQGRWEFDPVD